MIEVKCIDEVTEGGTFEFCFPGDTVFMNFAAAEPKNITGEALGTSYSDK